MVLKPDMLKTELRHEARGGKGDLTMQTVKKEDLPANARVFGTITIPQGSSFGVHEHVGEAEFYYIMSGEGIANDDGQSVLCTPGDIMITGDGHFHGIENNGAEDLVLLACVVLG